MIRYLRKRSISVFLVLCFLIISISTPTTEAIGSIDSKETSIAVNEHKISVEETVPIVIDSLNKNECMIGEYVNSQDFNAAEHIKRLPDEEELDTYVFLNENGSKSVYYMDENVKYIDATGAIKEKDVSLVAKSDGYGIARNEFDLHIPTVATSGIEMSHEGYTVKIIPQSTVKNVSAQEVNDSIVYDGFFGTNTKLKYTPMLSGIKEDIILETYIPNASFSFVLETDGLTLYNDGNDYWLAEDETSEAILHLGEIIIYDAVGKPEYGTMVVTTVTVGRKYVLSLSAPESYLTDPTTVYPVTIDPTLTVSDTVTGEGAIEDTTLFSNRTSKNYGDYRYLSIGYVDSTYGVGRVAVKLPGLYNSNNYLNASASDITSVKFYCWDSSGNSAQMVNIYRITSAAWNENEVTYGDSVSYSTATNWGKSMSNAVWTAFDITTLVRGWKTGSYSAAKGFIMVNPNETSASYKKAPYSSEYSNSSYRPYVVMTYTRMPNPDAQNKTNWCWAASSKMVGEHNGGSGALNTGASILTNTVGLHSLNGIDFFGETYDSKFTADTGQRQIVINIHNSDANKTGTTDNIEVSLEFASSEDMTIDTIGNGSTLSANNIAIMNSELSEDRWVIACVWPTTGGIGHAIVITDYNSSTQRYTYWDPWTDGTGFFTRTQILNNTITLTTNSTNRGLYYVVYCR